jgi:hypothetical protein
MNAVCNIESRHVYPILCAIVYGAHFMSSLRLEAEQSIR